MGIEKIDKESREADAFGSEGLHRDQGKNFKSSLERGEAQDSGRAREVPIDAFCWPKPDFEGKWLGMGEPTLKRLACIG
jgi:hypothetical protein